MKRIILIALLAAVSVAASAQMASPRYKELKQSYNPQLYQKLEGDPYSPEWASAVGFFFPGASQLVMREPIRGLLFFAGSAICSNGITDSYTALAKQMAVDSEGNPYFLDEDAAAKAMIGLIGYALGDLAIAIWSSIDAKKVAKVKNMYFQDMTGRQAIEMSVRPSVGLAKTPSGFKPAPGMTLALSF